ncbi:CHAT domain-containing protein [Streptomyces spinoverrucosus]|uniref:CHAT domain-containing tetratricopeptide repeat protein n=1 Tax=Streptomyces spinoverrucosus TaxID=284043 RepID=UPI0018C43BD2|nr:CHAT domain-containing protein [Streptomyces spinoverrucosus]MBG0857653.1 CHAT domain-containing protein [Streptomyces spinoverrucosus]
MNSESQPPARDRLLAAVRVRLRQVRSSGDAVVVRSAQAHAEAGALRALLAENPGDVEAAYRLGWLAFLQEMAQPWDDDRTPAALEAVVDQFAPCLLAGIDDLPRDLLRYIANAAEDLVVPRLKQTLVSSDPVLLDTVVEQCRYLLKATPAGHPGLPQRLANLGIALDTRFERRSTHEDLAAAIEAYRAAVDATGPDDPDLVLRLNGLAGALRSRYEQYGGDLADLDEAIVVMRRAVDCVPPGDPRRPMALSNLGMALRYRFQRGANPADLDDAIAVGRQAVQASAPDDPRRMYRLNNLADTLLGRFVRFQAMSDLDTAVTALREALDAIPADHPERWSVQTALGYALTVRVHRTKDLDDADAAVAVQRTAVRLIPAGHAHRWRVLLQLGVALHVRLMCGVLSGEPARDWGPVISAFRAAVDAVPPGHTQRTTCLAHLAGALGNRARTKDAAPADLQEAVAVARASVTATSPGDSELGHRLVVLGHACRTRFRQTGDPQDRQEAIASYGRAAAEETAPPSTRVTAARHGSRLLAEAADVRAADLLRAAVELLPSVAPRHLERHDQQYTLGEFAGLAADAVACTLARGDDQNRALRALQLLETGRGVLLSQALDTRSDLTELRVKHPELAARFVALREALDVPSQDSALPPLAGGTGVADGPAHRPRDMTARDFAAVLDEIRSLGDGFESFGLPPSAPELLCGAEHGPVVVVNVSGYGSSALLLTTDGVSAMALPRLRNDDLHWAVDTFQQALREATTDPDGDRRREAQKKLSGLLEWLWDVVAEPVLLRLGHDREPPAGADWPRVWWVPGGLLNLLPLHAAGYHGTRTEPDPLRRAVIDRVVSSYAPTVRALRHAQRRDGAPTTTPPQGHRALIVAMPTTPGLPDRDLAHVEMEREMLLDRLPRHVLLEPGGSGALTPTRDQVLAHLPGCHLAHFACHGETDPADPSRSRLLLADHAGAPLTVASLTPLSLDEVRLAFLSACRTAAVDAEQLVDEAIHLGSAFQLAGFPHVVGTLWDTADDTSVEIADAFYAGLSTDHGTLAFEHSAHALHTAVRTLRERTRLSPSLWAAHLHVGP